MIVAQSVGRDEPLTTGPQSQLAESNAVRPPGWLLGFAPATRAAHPSDCVRTIGALVVAAPPGTPVLLYATAPTMAVVGMSRIAAVHVATPSEVWSAHRRQTGITRREYDAYMSGATQASGLMMESPVAFDEPVTLNALRSAGSFHPPQSYRYMKGDELRQVAVAGPVVGTALREALGDLVPA
ncbi:hypothetical protein [Streptomyces lancefieldiae]|uniref:Uncharacterized protein n=1 Tax=Streptomyces lancefieldiae TaxID=3075520 RepID=A0ABU3ASR6_9ACTN|nr:hypothetical protein [Streptomyces sp. DSM 40712]MDT0613237.1 hypothetical protein [Streptomyces sp. DSM 40712]